MDCFGTYFTHAQSCDNVHVQSATEWTASVHALHMPKAVITFMFKVLGNGLLRYILYTLPKAVITFVLKVLLGTCSIFPFSRFRVFTFCRRHPRGRDTDFVCTAKKSLTYDCKSCKIHVATDEINHHLHSLNRPKPLVLMKMRALFKV